MQGNCSQSIFSLNLPTSVSDLQEGLSAEPIHDSNVMLD